MNSEVWDLYFQFDGTKFIQKKMCRSEIRYLNLLSIMEAEGYGFSDSMYFVKHEGEGLDGLELIDSHLKVEEMIRKYESSRAVVLTVMKDRRNKAIVVSPLKRPRSIHIDLDTEDEQPIAVQINTQNSVYYEKMQTQLDEHIPSQFQSQDSVYYGKGVAEEEEQEDMSDYNFTDDEEERELRNTIAEMRRRKNDPMLHCEGETDVEDIYDIQEEPEQILEREVPLKKIPKRPGPTTRSHSQVENPYVPQWVPSDDEEELGFLKVEDDDGYEPIPFVQPKGGRKSRAKKPKERVWYDETRQNPEQQFRIALCFRDVRQFREALSRLHIVQVRNFHFHRNTPDSIIVWCKQKDKFGCQFYMTTSKIKNEKTFCIKKMHLPHTCPTDPSNTRVNSKWLSSTYVDKFRSDINTGITTLQDKARKDFGVSVGKRAAYRARLKQFRWCLEITRSSTTGLGTTFRL